MLGLRDWYEWRPDPGDHEVTDTVLEGATNPELLEELHPAAVWHLLSALRRYDKLPVATVREIAFEVGLLGQTGLETRFILAGRIRTEMAPIVTKMALPQPSNEAQFRELARLKEVRQALAQLRALLEG